MLPEDNMIIDPTPQNPQKSSWRDRFSVNVSGKLTVSIDQKSGWGQRLDLKEEKAGVVNLLLIVRKHVIN